MEVDNIRKYLIQPLLYGVIVFLPFSIAISEMFICALLLAVLAHVAMTRSFSEFKSSLLYAVIIYILISLASALLCRINPKSVSEVSHLLLYIFMFACIYMGKRRMFTRWHLYVLIAALAFGSMNGIVQYFNDTGILGHRVPHKPGIAPHVRGTFSNSLTFVGVYGMALFFLVPLMGNERRWFAYSVRGVVLLLVVVLVLTFSRGALVVAIAIGLLYVIRQRKYLVLYGVGIAVVILVCFLVLPEYSERLKVLVSGSLTASSTSLRLMYWEAALDFFLDKPILGIGPGAFTAAYEMWKPDPSLAEAAHAHNQYLEVLATRGILGFISFLAILLIIFRRLTKHLRRTGKLNAHPMARGAFYAFLFICLSSLFENHFADEEIFNFCSLVTGLGLAYAERDADQTLDT